LGKWRILVSSDDDFNRAVRELLFRLDSMLHDVNLGVARWALTMMLTTIIVSYEDQDPDTVATHTAADMIRAIASRRPAED
jgi:hypothetical protein